MNHLTAERWKALLKRPEYALLAHVQEGCDTCDAFLASLPGLDGEVDRALLALAARPPSTDELAWARLRRRQRRAPLQRFATAAAAVALIAAVAVALSTSSPAPAGERGLKGSANAQLELRAALKSANGVLISVVEGARVPSIAVLVFQARSGLSGHARLFVQRDAAEPVELAQLGLVEGAQELEWDVEEGGRKHLLGFSLSGERGPLTVWLVAAEAPSTASAALAAIRAGGGGGLAVAHVRVNVVDTVSP